VRFGSGDHSSALVLYQRNRQVFLSRWQGRLGGRPQTLEGATERTLLAARDVRASGRVLVCDPAPDAVAALIETDPRLRISWVGTDESWLARGVELADEPPADWLANRPFFYDAVIVGPVLDPPTAAAITATQPQAVRVPATAPITRATLATWGIA
jgi:hypothetical protein